MTTFQNNYQLRMWISNSNLTFPALQSKGRSVTNTDSPTRSTQQTVFLCVLTGTMIRKTKWDGVTCWSFFFLFKTSGFLVAFFFNMQSPLNHLCSGLAPGVFGFFFVHFDTSVIDAAFLPRRLPHGCTCALLILRGKWALFSFVSSMILEGIIPQAI